MVVVNCSVPNCNFKTDDVSEPLAIALLTNHALAHQLPPATDRPVTASQGPRLDRPKIEIGVSDEEWNVFVRRWTVFQTGSQIDIASAPAQLFQCAGPDLGDIILKSNPKATSLSTDDLLKSMRSLAVIPVAKGVLRTELLQLQQQRDESFRAFAARVRGKAETCAFTTACVCGKEVDYTDNIIRDVLISGMYDTDIRREMLGQKDLLQLPINDVVALVETREMARNAQPSSVVSAVSSFQRHKRNSLQVQKPSVEQQQQSSCPDCKQLYHLYTEGPKGWNSKPHSVCLSCYRVRRRQKHSRPTNQVISQISVIESNNQTDQNTYAALSLNLKLEYLLNTTFLRKANGSGLKCVLIQQLSLISR